MKMEAFYLPVDDIIKLHCDVAAQKVLARAARQMNRFERDPEISRIMTEIHSDSLADFQRGVSLINRLGSDPLRKFESDREELVAGLHTLCGAALYFVEYARYRSIFVQALMLISGVVPFDITWRSLPPAVEVFDQKSVPQPVWQSFELLRLWSHPVKPQLPFAQIHQLWRELALVPSGHSALDDLKCELGDITKFFRFTMKSLSEVDFAQELAKQKKRNQK